MGHTGEMELLRNRTFQIIVGLAIIAIVAAVVFSIIAISNNCFDELDGC